LRERIGAHGGDRRNMENVEPALAPAKLVVVQANVEDDRLLGLGQIGNAKQILGFEIGDDDRWALAQNFLRFGDDVAVGRKQVFDQLVVLAEKREPLLLLSVKASRAPCRPLSVRGLSTRESGTGSG